MTKALLSCFKDVPFNLLKIGRPVCDYYYILQKPIKTERKKEEQITSVTVTPLIEHLYFATILPYIH